MADNGLSEEEIEFVREVIRAKARQRARGQTIRSWTTWFASVVSLMAVIFEAVRRLLVETPTPPGQP